MRSFYATISRSFVIDIDEDDINIVKDSYGVEEEEAIAILIGENAGNDNDFVIDFEEVEYV